MQLGGEGLLIMLSLFITLELAGSPRWSHKNVLKAVDCLLEFRLIDSQTQLQIAAMLNGEARTVDQFDAAEANPGTSAEHLDTENVEDKESKTGVKDW